MLKSRVVKIFIKFLISLFFVWWIVYKVNWTEVGFYLKKINPNWIIVYIFLYLLGMLVSASKWRILALHKDINLSLKEFFKLYFSATFINNFMPSFVGGDSFKIYQVGRLSDNFKGATSSVIMDRFTGLVGGMILVVFFALLNFNFFLGNKFLFFLLAASIASLLFIFLIFKFSRQIKFKTPLKNINKIFNKITGEISHYNNEKRIFLKVIGWSFLFNLVGLAGANFALFLALGIKISLLNYLSVIFLASVVATIPISINNIGVKEWAYITFFGLFGLSAGAVVSVAITSRIIQMLLSFIAWPIYLKEKNN